MTKTLGEKWKAIPESTKYEVRKLSEIKKR